MVTRSTRSTRHELKILFLHEVGYLEKPIFEMHEFPERLSAQGHQIAFVDFPEQSGPRGEIIGAEQRGLVISSAKVKLYSQAVRLPGIIGRLVAVLEFRAFFNKVLDDFQPQIIVSFAVPTSGWQALLESRRRGIPFVYRALDVSHKIRRTSFAPFIRMTEAFLCRHSNWVSCNNPAMKEYCVRLGSSSSRTSVDLPPLDLSLFSRAGKPSTDLRDKLGIPEAGRVLLYLGSFFYFSGLLECIQSLEKLPSKPYLVLVGGGEQDSELRSLVQNLNLESYVKFTGFVRYEDLPAYLSLAHVAINPMQPSLVSNTALPNKVLQYMASALPVVSTELRGLKLLFGNEAGLTLVSSSSEVLPAALSLIDRGKLSEFGSANRKAVEAKFNSDQAVDGFSKLLAAMAVSK